MFPIGWARASFSHGLSSWLVLHLLRLYRIPQVSVSDYKIRFLDIAYPGKASCFLGQRENAACTRAVPFTP